MEGVDKVTIFLFGTQEGVSSNFFSKSADRSILDFVTRGAADLFPTSEILAIEEGFESSFFKRGRIRSGRKAGGKPSPFFLILPVMITESWDYEESDE